VSAPSPELALIVCTRDRAARLGDTLAALGALRARRPWELVLVDNGSRDETAAVLAAFAARAARAPAAPGAPLAVTVVDEPRPGLTRARNAAVARTRAPILCFTDDDCYPTPDFLDRWAEVFDDPAVGYGGGTVELHDPADHPITVKPRGPADPRRPGAYVPAGLIHGANMAFRRELVVRAGGFDPDLGPGTPFNCEDVDMFARVSALGAAGGYFPPPTVTHHHGRRAGPAVDALERSYAHGWGAYRASLLLRRGARKHGVYAWLQMAQETAAGLRDPRRRVHAAYELLGGARLVAHRARRRVARALARPAE
jgi:glycosyltransferase involved in cell wall biosynthesis